MYVPTTATVARARACSHAVAACADGIKVDHARHSKHWYCCFNWPRQFELLILAEALLDVLGADGRLRLVWYGMQFRMFSVTCPFTGGRGVVLLKFMQEHATRVVLYDIALNVPLPLCPHGMPQVASWAPRRDAHGRIMGVLRPKFGIRYRRASHRTSHTVARPFAQPHFLLSAFTRRTAPARRAGWGST